MTIVPADRAGVWQAARALEAGRPVVLPLPTPLPYVVAAFDAAEVNTAKGRPADQATGVAVADFALVAAHVALDADGLALARWLAAEQLLSLLLPAAGTGAPAWLRPATRQGWLAVMLGWLHRTRPLLEQRGHLYLSSANRTGAAVAVTAPAADAAFAGELLVVDGDNARDPAADSGSATIVRVGPRRRLELARHGINDASYAGGNDRFLQELTERWERRHGDDR
jgi:tRNA A37 threonylcarbamoyladenosine synthetase subunit TsaC/SUA5/YrdC